MKYAILALFSKTPAATPKKNFYGVDIATGESYFGGYAVDISTGETYGR